MTVEDQRNAFEVRIAQARTTDRGETARRADVALKVVTVTLLWLVSVSLLLGLGVANGNDVFTSSDPAFWLAALVAVLLPFVAAVIATRNGRPWLGGAYVVLTLVMVLPAIGFLGLA